MRILKKIACHITVVGFLALYVSCASIFGSLSVEAGPNLGTRAVDREYSPYDDAPQLQGRCEDCVEGQHQATASSSIAGAGSASSFFGGGSEEAIPGFFIGASLDTPLNSKLSAQTGLRFSTKGSKTTIDNLGSIKTRLTYIDIPLQLRYPIRPKFTVQGGLQPSILLGANEKSEVNGDTTEQDVKDNYKGFDLAATLGVGYIFNDNLSVQLGYDHGFLNLEEQQGFGDVKNRVIRLGVLYTLKTW
ncbi:PorT family protein [Muricauda sp. SCSIO 64092]|uniref:porin family protein n=1 Tax=Allomuricauda sp. SCSIO 64092 TaxID=2908842 RepID=UPI001FF238EB|nr:porin family protein [Muricauda sp. SCSIO 64092]UOY08959.1 PorT family protein [Muricauda sp. SCSIO 64092]